jgi:hypothetical protein
VSVSHANISTSSRNESCRTLFPCKHAAVRGPTHAKCTVPYACTARGRGAWPGGCMQLVRSDCCDLAEAIVCSVYGGGVPATAQDQTSKPSKPGFPKPLGTGPVPPGTGRTGPVQYTNRSCSQSQTVPIIFYPHRTGRFHRFTGRFFLIRGNRYGGGLGNPAPSWLLCSYRAPLPFGPQWFLRLYVAGTAGFGIFSLCLCTNNVARTQTLSRGPYTTANYSILASVLIS